MGIRVWLDDIRPVPEEGYDVWVKDAREAYDLVLTGYVTFLDFDHDLGNSNTYDGTWLANEIEVLAMDNKIPAIRWNVHSSNPAGRNSINLAMKSAWRFWYENEKVS